jgi:hypothetical protein
MRNANELPGWWSVAVTMVLPGLNWIYSREVNDSIGLGGSTQFNRATDSETDNEYTLWAQSVAVGCSLANTVGAADPVEIG